ncbi:RNA methyltransferase [Chondrinema litorale]|uniref:RNA methyltransferase n=1 Tax=Chondrinema litorale TaxID=2994555 RepID=UPI0025434CE1|nr:RNA methyltransferase [Chondrinema litorale]UZR95901.1 RNA methyltransferase [Chondrinema litorale]
MRKLSMQELNRHSVESFKDVEKFPVVLVLDNIRSLNNVGSAFRTGDAFKVEKICLCGITGKPPHRDINKTALGATDSVSWEHYQSTESAVDALIEVGYKVIAIEQTENAIPLHEFDIETSEKYAFVFGNEVFGVEDTVLKKCEASLEIPQFGTKHSLNISVSIGIILWNYVKVVL